MITIENNSHYNPVPYSSSSSESVQGKGFGHQIKIAKERMTLFFRDLFNAIGKAFNERSPLGKIFKLSINVLTGIQHALGSTFRGAGLLQALNVVDTFNDFFDIVVDSDHLINRRYRKEDKVTKEIKINKCALIAAIAFFVADVVGLVLWLNDLAMINLAKVSATIGRGFSKLTSALGPGFAKFTSAVVKACPFVAKVIAKVTLVNVLRGIVSGAFLALAINECRKLVNAIRQRDIKKIVNRVLYLISYLAEVALKVLAIAGCASVPGLVAVGCIAAGFGLAAFLMKAICEYRKSRENMAKKQEVLASGL